MGKVIVSFIVSVVIDKDEEREAGVDLDRKITKTLAEMEDIAHRDFDFYESNIEIEGY